MVVAAVAFVDVDAAGFDLDQRIQFANYGRRACSTKWPPPLSRGQAFGFGGRRVAADTLQPNS
jgi:hypothetical protein